MSFLNETLRTYSQLKYLKKKNNRRRVNILAKIVTNVNTLCALFTTFIFIYQLLEALFIQSYKE